MSASDTRLKDLMKLFHQSSHTRKYPFVSVEQQNEYWSHCDENIPYSIFGLHYGQHKAHSFSILISSTKYNLGNIDVKNGTLTGRWKIGLSIMLENAPGNFLVEKLCALFLLEADLNALHKIPALKISSAISQ